ncbi:MAG: RNA polymerase sigma factor [Flavobacteriales bacterium]|jgi:RNA polymerase sigma-70 factor (ECF subfamily)
MLSFANLYKTYVKLVYNTALHYVRNIEDAEEVTQNVFLKIDQHLSQFRKESNIKTWIYRITVNESLDFLKAKKRRKRWALFTTIDEKEISTEHPGMDYEYKEELEQLLKWIDELPEPQRSAIILCRVEGLSIQETADVLELSYKSVEGHLSRAKQIILEKKQSAEGK